MNYNAIIEGLLFVCGEEGLSIEELCSITEKEKDEVSDIIKNIFNYYNTDEHGIQLEFLGNKFKFTTKEIHKQFYKKLAVNETNTSLGQSSLETLAIIAYNGPITRIDIDEIRGVNSSYVVRKLLLRGLIEDVGKADSPGKPKIYNVTSKFLDYFGLGTINDLPKIKIEEPKNIDDADLFNSRYHES